MWWISNTKGNKRLSALCMVIIKLLYQSCSSLIKQKRCSSPRSFQCGIDLHCSVNPLTKCVPAWKRWKCSFCIYMQDIEYIPPKHVYTQKHVHTTPTLTQQPLSQWWKVPLVSAVLALPVSPQILVKLPVYWKLNKLYASTLQDIRHTNNKPHLPE